MRADGAQEKRYVIEKMCQIASQNSNKSGSLGLGLPVFEGMSATGRGEVVALNQLEMDRVNGMKVAL